MAVCASSCSAKLMLLVKLGQAMMHAIAAESDCVAGEYIFVL